MEDIPKAAYTIPLGVAGLRRLGTDITLVGWGPTVETLLTASNLVSKTDGINPEVIDLRTLMPWDAKAVEESVRKTGRLIVCHEVSMSPFERCVTFFQKTNCCL